MLLFDLIRTNDYWIELKDYGESPFDFEAIFGNPNPVEIEMGAGKSKFLVDRARANPDRNFLAIDRCGKWMKMGFQKAEREELPNIKFLRANFLQTLENNISPESVCVFHVYFPDPWPKRKHQKRRILTASFFEDLWEKLTSGGLIEITTDDGDYYQFIQEAISKTTKPWARKLEKINERIFDTNTQTNYEFKWESAGRTLHYIELQK